MVGDHIQHRRQDLGLSLQELGRRTGLTAGFLSRVENGQVSPSLASLQRIATALDTPMFRLLDNGHCQVPVVRSAECRRLHFPAAHIDYELLTPDLTHQLAAFRICMQPGARRVADRLARRTEEWMYVLEGRLEIVVDHVTFVLERGDAISYDGEALVEFAAAGDQELKVLCIMTPPAL